jgi:hypothetical protein
MSLDPRVLSTPIGAVIGLVIAKKALKPDDQTVGNLTIGAGLGAGAGFLTGQYIRGEQLALGNVTADRLRQNIRSNALKDVKAGTKAQIAALNKHTPGGLNPGTPTKHRSGGPWERTKYNFVAQKGMQGAVEQRAWHLANAQELNRVLKSNSSLTQTQRDKIRSNVVEHQRRADAHDSALGWASWKGRGHLAAWRTLWGYIAGLA